MVNRNLIRSLEDDSITLELDSMFPLEESEELLLNSLHDTDRQFDVNQIVEGRVVEINEEFVVVDVGFKSEGAIHRNEWGEGEDLPAIGSTVKVLIEEVEDQFGNVDGIEVAHICHTFCPCHIFDDSIFDMRIEPVFS